MDREDKKKGEGGWKGADHAAPYPVSRLAPPVSLVEMAREIEEADRFTGARVNALLEVIAGQIEDLQNKAREIMADARREQELHRADCAFKKIPGRVYHLYLRDDGRNYFSMLSPKDWNGKPPHSFQGSFRLGNDMTWAEENYSD